MDNKLKQGIWIFETTVFHLIANQSTQKLRIIDCVLQVTHSPALN